MISTKTAARSVTLDDVYGEEIANWMRLTPQQRWAESRALDLADRATEDALPKLAAAMQDLSATVIAVPPFELQYLQRGHAVHFSVPDAEAPPLRVDVISRMRGVAPFETLWERRTTVILRDDARSTDVNVELMALEDRAGTVR